MSETVAHSRLSDGTRQCACGGWTRFVVCQYCGTTDPAVAAAGWVSSSPLTVPTAFDPVAVPPPGVPASPAAPVPAPLVAQHDAPAMAAASAFADLHAPATPLAAMSPPAAPPAPPVAAPSYPPPAPPAPVGFAPPAMPDPFTAPVAPVAPQVYAPAGDPGAALVGAAPVTAAPVTAAPSAPAAPPAGYPAPLPVPPGASWPQGEGPDTAAAAPMPAPEAPVRSEQPAGSRPRWLVPAAAAAVVVVAGSIYLFGVRGSSTNSNNAAPPVHGVVPGTALLQRTLPAGYAMSQRPRSEPVAQVTSSATDGHATTGALSAVVAVATGPAGQISIVQLQFPSSAAATAFTKDTKKHQATVTSSFATRGPLAYAVTSTSGAKAKAPVDAWASSLGI